MTLIQLSIKCQKRTDRFFHLIKSFIKLSIKWQLFRSLIERIIKTFDQVKSLKKFDQVKMKLSINWKKETFDQVKFGLTTPCCFIHLIFLTFFSVRAVKWNAENYNIPSGHDHLLEIRLLEKSARHDFIIARHRSSNNIFLVNCSNPVYL